MTADIFIEDGIEIRRLKSDRCIPEDEWKQSVELNEVCPPTHPKCGVSDIVVALALVVHAKEPTVREASPVVQTRSEIRSLPSQAEFWDRDPRAVFPVPPGGP